MASDVARLSRIEQSLDALLKGQASIEAKLEGIPNRVQVLETVATRIDTTVTAIIGTTTRQELRMDGVEKRQTALEVDLIKNGEERMSTLEKWQAAKGGERDGVNWMLEFLKIGGAGGLGAALAKLMGAPS